MVLFTTRIPNLVSKLGTSKDLIIELKGLANDIFEKYFLACVFGQQEHGEDHYSIVKDIGSKIVEKLKCSPLAAKTIGRLLRGNLSEDYSRSVLQSKEWEKQKDDHDIMPALKLSYEFLPLHLQQCFNYCALFPEDYAFGKDELIHLWIGHEILLASGQNKRAEDIGCGYLDELLMLGFFNKVQRGEEDRYVIHDLLRELALAIASNGCLSICYSNVRSVEVHPSVRHLSIVMRGNADHGGGMTDEYFIRELKRLKKRLKVENLETLLLFDNGSLKGSFGYLFKEVSSLRVLHVSEMTYPVYRVLENFSKLIHLRYLRIGAWPSWRTQFKLPSTVSRFYHLRILDLNEWYHDRDLPSSISNLVNLHYFVVNDENLHSEISMVGKLQLLRVLNKFQVKRRQEGFNLKELESLMEVTKLGIYNLENVVNKEEADVANLTLKNHLLKLTLHWDKKSKSDDPVVERDILESLKPHSNLKELSIIGHKGYTFPEWLGSELSVRGLESLHLEGVEWLDFTTLEQLNLQSLKISDCSFLSLLPIPWTPTLCDVGIRNTSSIQKLDYERTFSYKGRMTITGTSGLSLDEVLAFDNLTELKELIIQYCLPLAELHLRKLNSLKRLSLYDLDVDLLPSSNGLDAVKWQLPVEQLELGNCFVSEKNLTRLL
ncbi:hypothetical protein EJB05_40747, partial [Eragrostis curvula]